MTMEKDPAATPRTGGAAAARPRPVFIIGAPRSATSALVWAIGQHPNIQPMPETAWIASQAIGSYLSWVKGSERGKFSHLSNVDYPLDPFMARCGEAVDAIVHDVFETRCRQFYGDYRARGTLARRPGAAPRNRLELRHSVDDPKQRWIDGTPLNSHYTWILAQLFPEARFIHSLRRPEDVVASLEGFDKVGARPQPLEEGIATWMQHTEDAWHTERAFGADRVLRIDFAGIGQAPETVVRAVLGFLGEPYSPHCVVPLERKLNSSEVEDRRGATRDALRGMPSFEVAQRLYEQILAAPVPVEPEASAMEVIHQRFVDYCRDRSLI